MNLTTRRGIAVSAVVVIACAVLGGVAGWFAEHLRTPQWQSTSTVLVQATPASALSLLLSGTSSDVQVADLVDVANLASSQGVLENVAEELGGGTRWSDLSGAVSAQPTANSHLVTITAVADSAERSRRIAALDAAALAKVQQQQVTAAMRNLPAASGSDVEGRAQVLATKLVPLQVVGAGGTEQTVPSTRTPVGLAVVGLAAGGLVVAGLTLPAALAERRRRAWSDPEPRGDESAPEPRDGGSAHERRPAADRAAEQVP